MKDKCLFFHVVVILSVFSSCCFGLKPMTDDEIKQMIIQGDIASFEGVCPCPYSLFKKNQAEHKCGDNSAYIKYSSNKPRCYPEDILRYEITDYRNEHDIPKVR